LLHTSGDTLLHTPGKTLLAGTNARRTLHSWENHWV